MQDRDKNESLYIVMPAYNEEANIETVANEWHEVAVQFGTDSRLVIFNDGSRDNTWAKLIELEKVLPNLIAVNKENSGHGATLRIAYEYALKEGADYIFQTDSDGQTLPGEFLSFWHQRNNFVAVIGHRNHRQDGFSRKFVTKVLKWVVFLIFRVRIPDANTPFRLMQRATLERYLPRVPEGYNLTNVLLSVLMADAAENVLYVPITFRPRQGGKNSINMKRIFKIGLQALRDFRVIKKEMKQGKR
ncbi:MAG: glycosyltransferase family 2 protein [Clostridiales bacterium]|nr:glycosyltransferase family 2 protein [Clostridiales bacterium]